MLATLGPPELVSVNSAGTGAGNGPSFAGRNSISDDGRYAVFTSSATDLVSGVTDGNGTTDVFFRDLVTGQTTLLSANAAGNTANGISSNPVISADGNFAAFESRASDIASAPTSGNTNVFLWQRATGNMTLVSVNSAGTDGGNNHSVNPSISGDGSVVGFRSAATDLIAGLADNNSTFDVFIQTGGTTTLVSSNADLTAAGNGFSSEAIVSHDGSKVVFLSSASDMVAGVLDNNNTSDVFRFDVATGAKEVLSLELDTDASGNFASSAERNTISDDGRFHVFVSKATNLVNASDTNNSTDVFLLDFQTGQTTLISATAAGSTGNGASDQAVISADGNFVAYRSRATDLEATNTTNRSNIHVLEPID